MPARYLEHYLCTRVFPGTLPSQLANEDFETLMEHLVVYEALEEYKAKKKRGGAWSF